ncbi:hypothetical protein APE01nite_08720 [Acetobacter peroxydans]|uniref:Uncharacterized protein n=1 Tax=Acetobacter peroxydans TaxID=104098 RepID=A0A4Y3TWF1_9PROT|nr:hypothetical protein AA0475_0845 [Acetobacter peroxydans]GEB85075.1 hypothetical protein APE01nite_08720 [Acetobacter peroxydans]
MAERECALFTIRTENRPQSERWRFSAMEESVTSVVVTMRGACGLIALLSDAGIQAERRNSIEWAGVLLPKFR